MHLVGENLTTTAEFTVGRRDRVPFVLGWFPSHDPRPVPSGAAQLVARTTKYWRNWSTRCDYSGQWREPVRRSLLTLESLTYLPTGGIVAAPTTSLPETLGGSRNWDYRFCWVRDATLTLEALIAGGYAEEAARWREWLLRAAAGRPEELQTMYGVAGERRLTEIELDWLPGYGGAKPVRTGNAAHEQLQLDVYGELADVLWQGVRADMMLSGQSWSLLRLLLGSLEDRWREPDEGIWEVRGPRRHFTHSKVMCWVAFDRAVAIAEEMDFDGPLDRWRAIRDEIHDQVCERGYNAELGAFTQTYDSAELDAAVLMIPLVGFLPATDPRVDSTIAAIRKDVSEGGLTSDGYVMRYVPTHEAVDGIGEREGVFLPCSFWLVEALALAGHYRRRARLVRAPPRDRQRRGAVRRGVRPRGAAPARQLPAGVHAPGPRGRRAHPRARDLRDGAAPARPRTRLAAPPRVACRHGPDLEHRAGIELEPARDARCTATAPTSATSAAC